MFEWLMKLEYVYQVYDISKKSEWIMSRHVIVRYFVAYKNGNFGLAILVAG